MSALTHFLREFTEALHNQTFERLTLSRPAPPEKRRNLYLRPLLLDGVAHLQLTHRLPTNDRTENLLPSAACTAVTDLLGTAFLAAHLETTTTTFALLFAKKGPPKLSRKTKTAASTAPLLAHDRKKQTLLTPELCPWLHDLGLADDAGRILPSRTSKWKQVHRFIELLDHAWNDLPTATHSQPLTVFDMGCGKGYLTFALDTWLNDLRKINSHIRGIEQRPDLAAFCNGIAQKHHRTSLLFQHGKIESIDLTSIDILIALHACDTATDHALAAGIHASAKMIVVAPCCQHDVRKNFSATPPIAGLFGHGLIEHRQAALLTDTLRILVLETRGYRVRAVEFVDADHTDKNLLLIAVNIQRPDPAAITKLNALKSLFNLTTTTLENLLA